MRTGKRKTETKAAAGAESPRYRAAWSGFLRLGPTVAPVRAIPVVAEPKGPELHLYHKGCGERIRCPRMCPQHGAVESNEIVKGLEAPAGDVVLLDEAELAAVAPERSDELVLERFESLGNFDLVRLAGQHYFVTASAKPAALPLAAISEGLEESGRVGIGSLVFGGKERLVGVLCRNGQLTMHTLWFPDWIRKRPERLPLDGTAVGRKQVTRFARRRDARVVWDEFRDPTVKLRMAIRKRTCAEDSSVSKRCNPAKNSRTSRSRPKVASGK